MGVVFRFSKQAAAEGDSVPYGFECVRRELLWDETDQGTRLSEILDDVETFDEDRPGCWIDDAADRADQCRFSGAVGSEKRKYLAARNVEIDFLERLESRSIGFRKLADGDSGLHGGLSLPGRPLSYRFVLRRAGEIPLPPGLAGVVSC